MDVLNNELFRSFREIKRAFMRIIRENAEAVGLTVPQLMVLHILSKNPNIGLGELSDHLQQTNSTMSGVVDRLVNAGLIIRRQSSNDRRAITLELTDKGRAIYEEAAGPDSIWVKRLSVLSELPDEDIQTVMRIHQQILQKLEKAQGEDSPLE